MRIVKFLQILAMCFLANVNCQAQTNTYIEKEQVTKVINQYFEGWRTGNLEKLDSVFHSSCHIKFFKNNIFTSWDKQTYFDTMIVESYVKENVKTEIISIDITGNAASVKVLLTTPEFLITDYINLLKINEGWFFVDKVATKIKTN